MCCVLARHRRTVTKPEYGVPAYGDCVDHIGRHSNVLCARHASLRAPSCDEKETPFFAFSSYDQRTTIGDTAARCYDRRIRLLPNGFQ
jgi:hypothetical protein